MSYPSYDLTANQYQTRCNKTAIYPKDQGVVYTILGLGNEAGELQGKYKKFIRDKQNWEDVKENLKAELGDVLWYCAQLATELQVDLEAVMRANLNKLESRQTRGVLSGSGDNR